ncbi:MAG: beta-galactosidase [Planctomycetota bacterium]
MTYDDRSFLIDGHRVWLVSGAIHYFRVPRELWRDRLAKAQAGGLNCIETYVAWNRHERHEGQWDFSGDNDVVEFIQQAADLGLYVIVRPGPYICAEWDFGGFPAWLGAKKNIHLRSPDAVYTHYYGKYFRQLLPRLADLQVTRGGNIVAIQNENEYAVTSMPERMDYLNYISHYYRRAGIDVPILTCNLMTRPFVPDAVECLNGYRRTIEQVKRLRTLQRDKPLLATEYWCGWFDGWGDEHARKDARDVARRAMELTGAGCQINYYMYHGGTNFGFSGGRTVGSDHHYMTTSYDYDAPIAEGGALTRKYGLLRLVNLPHRTLGHVLATAAPVAAPAAIGHTAVHWSAGEGGTVVVVSNGGDDHVSETAVALADGRTLDVDLSHYGAALLLLGARITDRHTLDESNLTPLGLLAGRTLVLHGAPGQDGHVSVNGRREAVTVPEGEGVALLDVAGLPVMVVNSALAERCWEVDDAIVIGPAFAGETLDDLVHQAGAKTYTLIDGQGKVTHAKVKAPASRPSAKPPTLRRFTALGACTAIDDPIETFNRLDGPRPMGRLEVPDGYGWYRTTITLSRAARKHLYLPGCADRARIYVNGAFAGLWGRGPGATREPIPVPLQRGDNEVTLLVDNLGRFNFGDHMGEAKGMWDQIYAARTVGLRAWRINEGTGKEFSRRMVPRAQAHRLDGLTHAPAKVCRTTFTLSAQIPVHLRFTGLEATVVVLCNDRFAGFFAAGQGGFGDLTLDRELVAGSNRLTLLVWPDVTAKALNAAVRLYRLESDLTGEATWAFRRWAPPEGRTGGSGAKRPAWFVTTFARPAGHRPLFVRVAGATKGQLLLNGRNVGRFWTIGPQEAYYLPEPWLEKTNELMIFSEDGTAPTRTKLVFKPEGPYG